MYMCTCVLLSFKTKTIFSHFLKENYLNNFSLLLLQCNSEVTTIRDYLKPIKDGKLEKPLSSQVHNHKFSLSYYSTRILERTHIIRFKTELAKLLFRQTSQNFCLFSLKRKLFF